MALPGGLRDSFYGGFFILMLGTMLLVIGVFTKSWSVAKSGDTVWGLYKACSSDSCGSYRDKPYSLIAAQAFGGLAVIASVVALLATFVIFVLAVSDSSRSREIPKVVLICSIAALVTILFCLVIYGVAIHDDMSSSFKIGYSFILTIIGGLAVPIGGLLVYDATKSYF